jgi:hypothetical protein
MKARHIILPLMAALAMGVILASGVEAGKPSGDKTPPAAVSDLSVDPASTTHHSVTLRWTATGDNGKTGTAASYDIRYVAGAPLTDANWAIANQAIGELAPKRAGSAESFLVGGLSELTNYHFAMKVVDKAGNISALSNNAAATTIVTPSGGWAVETATTKTGFYKAMAFDEYGMPGIGIGETEVWVTLWNGSAWTDQLVDHGTEIDFGSGMDFAFAPGGVPSVIYARGSQKFAYRSGTQWIIDVVDPAAYNDFASLLYDPTTLAGNPEPTIAYGVGRNNGGALKFARKVGGLAGDWVTQQVDSHGGWYASLAYRPDGNPSIAYSDDLNSDGLLDSVKFARWDAANQIWTGIDGTPGIDIVDSGGVGTFIALAYNPVSGYPAIAYSGVHFATWDGTQWNIAHLNAGNYTALAFDGSGVPFISHTDGGLVKVAWLSAGTWHYDNVDVAVTRTDIAVDPVTGKPSVMYQAAGMKLARRR